jgi:hypothetical protein
MTIGKPITVSVRLAAPDSVFRWSPTPLANRRAAGRAFDFKNGIARPGPATAGLLTADHLSAP